MKEMDFETMLLIRESSMIDANIVYLTIGQMTFTVNVTFWIWRCTTTELLKQIENSKKYIALKMKQKFYSI